MLEKDDKINDYVLIKFLGKGQFGEVWLAEKQIKSFNRKIRHALKFLSNQEDEINIKAAEDEIDSWIKASGHPNVMAVLDMFIYKSYVVIVSEYAEGGSLKDWLYPKDSQNKPLIENRLEMMLGVLRGIEHLHSRRVVHRDLKPDNILIQGNFPRITDFGISRIIADGTLSTKPIGSPVYMSPESFAGSKSPQTDIWSAGVILYEILSGKYPFHADTYYELIERIKNTEPKPLSAEIPVELRNIVEKALHKEKSKRFQTAKEMRSALEKINYKLKEKVITFTPFDTVQTETLEMILEVAETQASDIEETRDSAELQREKQVKQQTTIPEVLRLKPNSGEETQPIYSKRKMIAVGGVLAGGLLILLTGLFAASKLYGVLFQDKNSANINSQIVNANSQTPKPEPSSTPFAPQIELGQIPAGSFMMGAEKNPSAKPIRNINFKEPFLMGKYEVTQAQWKAVMGNNPSYFNECGERCPVEKVSWSEVKEFIKRLNDLQSEFVYRLPSEAEWEYACRAGTETAYAFGDKLSLEDANFDGREKSEAAEIGGGIGKTREVGSYQPNAWGLYDMHGNIREWCEDIKSPNYENLPMDGSPNLNIGDSKFRVVRGGSYKRVGILLHSYARDFDLFNNNENSTNGFRLVAKAR